MKIYKMGNKLGFYFPKDFSDFEKGDMIKIKIKKEDKESIFLTKFNRIITIRKLISNSLSLYKDEAVDVELKGITEFEKPEEIFNNNKIDLPALIPKYTERGYKIFVTDFEREGEEWLRIWYSHERGSGKQLEIKRFIDIDSFGRLLGQLQAEGTKSGRKFRLEFCNKLIEEHIDYISYLEGLGIKKELLIGKCDFHPDVDNIDKKVKEFEIMTEVPVKYVIKTPSSKGSYGFKTYMRNVLLTEIVLNSLDMLRGKLITESHDDNLRILADSFFAKLLTGDGTLDITTKNREYNFPEARIKIVDGNLEYLKDYASIMEKLGFNPKINEKHIQVRSYAGFDKLIYLYKIKAFQNTPNWKKLILLINDNLKGRRLKTHLRFVDLLENKKFTGKDLVDKYGISLRTANGWLNNKEKEGFVLRVNRGYPVKWALTDKAKELATILSLHKKELANLNREEELLLTS